MGLQSFLKEIQEQDNGVIYSKVPDEPIKAIPPEKYISPATSSKKQENNSTSEFIQQVLDKEKEEKPRVVTFKLKSKPEPEKPKAGNVGYSVEHIDYKASTTTNTKSKEPAVKQEPKPQVVYTKEETIIEKDPAEELFMKSETPIHKKEMWMKLYEKALNSRKENYVSDKMRRGRFSINKDNQIEILAELDTSDKNSGEVLLTKWL